MLLSPGHSPRGFSSPSPSPAPSSSHTPSLNAVNSNPQNPRKRNSSSTVLDEDTYVAAIEKIIERDYFPDIPKLRDRLDLLEASRTGDPILIRDAQLKIIERRSGKTAGSDTAGKFRTPGSTFFRNSVSLGFDQTPVENVNVDKEKGSVDENADSMDELTLDAFFRRYTSEDNESFSKLIEKVNKRKKERYGFLLDGENRGPGGLIEDVKKDRITGYLATPWLSSPHLQTILLNALVKTPKFMYKRELFHTSDGGTIALDWLMNSDVAETSFQVNGNSTSADIPLLILVPGLTSDQNSPYIKEIAYKMAKHGWNVVVSNHRGLGGVPLTSECFYTAGKSDDLGEVVNYLHRKQPETPLYALGTSLGANILVKYLGEDGVKVPLVGAVSISNPWDLLIGDRFYTRGTMQKFYNRVLGNSLKGAAKLHQEVYARLSDWEGIEKSRSIRDFNNYSARIAGNFETIDAFHRWASSARLVTNVSVPLFCLNAIDDPVCTDEAIPWDEIRKNKNVVLATTEHGGHIAYFEGISGKSLWWIRVVEEYLSNLHASQSLSKQQMHKFKELASETLQFENSLSRDNKKSV